MVTFAAALLSVGFISLLYAPPSTPASLYRRLANGMSKAEVVRLLGPASGAHFNRAPDFLEVAEGHWENWFIGTTTIGVLFGPADRVTGKVLLGEEEEPGIRQ